MAANRMQRRLAAIVVADVVGYSRLTGADEEGTVKRLRALRREVIDPAIAAHHGRLFKTAGDSALAEFGSVVDAARYAIAIQRGTASRNIGIEADRLMQFRIGIHLGDVVVHEDGDLAGDGVNIAARLEGLAEPGGIRLSSAAFEEVRDKIDATFLDLGECKLREIKRLIHIYSIPPEAAPFEQRSAEAGGAADQGGAERPRLSIVVLPFENFGDDAEHDYFVDGVTESLTTDLSRMSGSFVIARNTAFTYKNKNADVKQIGRELGVRYALEGSVQCSGRRMRVNVQLIDTETGSHLWAKRFDKHVADFFDLQDEIVALLANQLHTELVTAEARRAQRTPAPDSIDLYFQGMASWNEGKSPDCLSRARRFFERALALDPGNIEALAGTGYVDYQLGSSYMTDDRAARLAAAEASLTAVLLQAPDHAMALAYLGAVHVATNRAEQGIAECRRAYELNPNLAVAHAVIGLAQSYLGRGHETEAHMQEALRLSPYDTSAVIWEFCIGLARFYSSDDEGAVLAQRRAIETNRSFPLAHFYLAATLAQLDRPAEAEAAARAGLALDPSFTLARFQAGAASDHPVYLKQRARVAEGLRRAGVPER